MNVPYVTEKCPKTARKCPGRDSRARIGKWDIVPSHFVSRDTVPLSQAGQQKRLAEAAVNGCRQAVLAGKELTEKQQAVLVKLGHNPTANEWKPGRKFDAWLAGASAEQQARWDRMQSGLVADPVKDEQLPPALRGGALEAF